MSGHPRDALRHLFPRKLLIGGHSYTVDDAACLIQTEGEHRRTSGRILLDPGSNSSQDRVREVLMHEILHAIRNNGGHDEQIGDDWKAGLADTERFICSIQWGLIEVLRANPDLVRYLTEPDDG